MPLEVKLLRIGTIACCLALGAAGLALLWRSRHDRGDPPVPWLPGSAMLLGSGILAAASLGAGSTWARLALLVIMATAAIFLPREARLPGPRPLTSVISAVALAIAFLDLVFRLGDPALPVREFFIWERDVLWHLEQEMKGMTSVIHSLPPRLTWQAGLLSSGGDSLLYGFPALLLLSTARASVILFRLPAALLALGSLLLSWSVARKIYGASVAATTAWMWLLAPPFVVYASYGTSVTAMWVSVWLAIGAVCHLLERPSVGRAILALGALYLATLQYAPGRLAATGLFLLSLGMLVFSRDLKNRLPVIAVLAVGALGAFFLNKWYRPVEVFYAVRGETLLTMRSSAEEASAYLDQSVPTSFPLSARDTVKLASSLVRLNAPNYAWIVAPVDPLSPPHVDMRAYDPPQVPLVLAPALPLVVWGFVLSMRSSGGSPRPGRVLVAAFLLATIPLLLTNRVDVARLGVLLPFLAVWGGLGAADLGTRITQATTRSVALGIGVVFCSGLLLQIQALGLNAPLPRSEAAEALLAEIRSIPGPVRIATRSREIHAAWLEALVRSRSHRELLPVFPPSEIVERLTHEDEAVGLASNLSADATLLLAPASDFPTLQRDAEARGLHPRLGGTATFPVLRFLRGADTPIRATAEPTR